MSDDPRESRIRLAEGELEAAWWGKPADAAPTLVLLHEGLGCVALWRDFPAWLAAGTGCGVFAWSRLGYGSSDPNPPPWPLDYMRREATDVLPRVLYAAGIRRAVLVGHSDGGSIAALYGANAADPRIAGLVLIAPHFFTEPVGLAAIAQARDAYQEGEFRTKLARYHEHVDHAFWGWNRAWLDPDFATGFDLAADLARLRLPTLVVQGEEDPYGTAAQAEAAARTAPGPVEVLLVPGARHAPHLEAADPTRPAIAAFALRVLGE
jgi:pimeloyl-ACP methyl ester carboxylesterase